MSESITGAAALLQRAKLALRITTDTLDDEVLGLVDAALADMTMRGIDAARLCPADAAASGMNPLAVSAVLLYCKGQFGMAGDGERGQYLACYENLTQSMTMAQAYRIGGEADAGDESTD